MPADVERGQTTTRRIPRWLRNTLIGAVVVGALALAYHLALPHVVEAFIMGQVRDTAEALDRRIDYDRFELEKLHQYSFYNFTISDEGHPERPFLSVARLTVRLDRTRLFAGQPVLVGLELEAPTIFLRDFEDGTSNYARLYERVQQMLGLRPPDQGHDGETLGEGPTPSEQRREGALAQLLDGRAPSVTIQNARLDVNQAADGRRPPAIDNLSVSVVPKGDGFACDFEAAADVEQIHTDLITNTVHRVALQGTVNPGDELAEVTVALGEPIELAEIPGLPEVRMRVGAVGFEYPYLFRFRDVEVVDRRTRTPVLEAPEIVVSLREVTTDPERFYISLLQAEGLRLFVEMDRDGNTNIDRLLGVGRPGLLASLVPRNRVEPSSDQPDQPNADDGPPPEPGPWERELRRRRWWEVAPQTTELNDVRIEVAIHEDDGRPIRTLDLSIPSVRAAQRLLNFQMDVVTRAVMTERGTGNVAALDVEFVYYYMTDHWDLDVTLEDIELARLLEVSVLPNPLDLQSGQMSGRLAVADDRPEGDLDIRGELNLDDFGFAAETVDAGAIRLPPTSYAFAARYDTQATLEMRRGDLRVGDMEAQVMLDFANFDLSSAFDYLLGFKNARVREQQDQAESHPLPWTEARLRIDLPPQPVMQVFHALPEALRERLDDTIMTGEVGWDFDLTVTYALDEDGRLGVSIPEPEVAEVSDEGLELVSLPEDVDVRLLLEDFDFTFVDGIGESRRLVLGPENPRWTPLDQISPMMIASILNTEDQSFFDNDGFNWTQLRRVVAQFLEERTFGRGASTISMQLVKNVLLSRERLLSRKLTEMFLTYWMTRLVPKERILEIYLNIIEFGPGINGIAEASEHYFGKLPIDLTLSEATFFVSIVPNPRMYHFYYEQGMITDRWWEHMQLYIQRLFEREIITPEEYETALASRPEFYLRGENDPALRPPPEPALPPDFVLPFLEDIDPPDAQERASSTREALRRIRERQREADGPPE